MESRFRGRGDKNFVLQLKPSVLVLLPLTGKQLVAAAASTGGYNGFLETRAKWRHGTRIFITVRNDAKVLESLLLQLCCTLNPAFPEAARSLKLWLQQITLDAHVRQALPKPQALKWTTVVLLFVEYLQSVGQLPRGLTRDKLQRMSEKISYQARDMVRQKALGDDTPLTIPEEMLLEEGLDLAPDRPMPAQSMLKGFADFVRKIVSAG